MTKKFTIDEIWQAYCDHEKPDSKFLEDLIWHIDHDENSWEAMHMAADLRRSEAIPAIANQLEHENSSVREGAATSLCRLLAYGNINPNPDIDKYATKIYHAAKYDDDIGNRYLIASFIECIVDLVGPEMRTQICELYHDYTRINNRVKFVYDAMLYCIGEDYNAGEMVPPYPDFVDVEKVQRFRDKYNI